MVKTSDSAFCNMFFKFPPPLRYLLITYSEASAAFLKLHSTNTAQC